MSKIKLKEIANAIREKDGTTDLIVANDFATRIKALPSGKYNLEVVDENDGTQSWNLTDWDYVAPLVFDTTFANNTPAQISAVSEEIASNGYTSTQVAEIYGWNLGDTIPITLTSGEVIEMQIIGINHDDLSDGSGKAGLTLQMKDCLATLYPMNNENINAGGYAASVMKTSTLPTIKALLPQEWQNVIKLVDKKSANGGDSNYSATLILSEDIFLLSQIEVFGTNTYAQDGANEGVWYEYYETNNTEDVRIKKYDKNASGVADTAVFWWLRSCNNSNTSHVVVVDMYGRAGRLGASSSRGVAFGFCI